MGVWLTGDIHGDPGRFSKSGSLNLKKMKKDDYVICLGDFGLVWNVGGESRYEAYWLDWLENKPFTMLFIDGNHENFDRLDAYPVEEWHGGKVHFIRPSVIHLMRGQIYTIEEKTFFTFGGAASHDISDGILDADDPDFKEMKRRLHKKQNAMYRVRGVDWWERELPGVEEMQEGLERLKEHQNRVDFILTHTTCTSLLGYMTEREKYGSNRLTDYLQEVKEKTEYGLWAFGHMHREQEFRSDKAVCLYYRIIRIL